MAYKIYFIIPYIYHKFITKMIKKIRYLIIRLYFIDKQFIIATIVGFMFGQLINMFRKPIKYFPAIFFLLSHICFIRSQGSIEILITGCIFSGIANGIGVPYLNTIASIKGGNNSVTTVMPLLSASLYLGQFISPIIVTPLSQTIFGENDIYAPYKIGIIICVAFIYQVWPTRHFQSLPPKEIG